MYLTEEGIGVEEMIMTLGFVSLTRFWIQSDIQAVESQQCCDLLRFRSDLSTSPWSCLINNDAYNALQSSNYSFYFACIKM